MDLMASLASSKLAGNRNYTHNLRRRIVGNPEVTLDRPLAESWIGVGKSAYHHLSQNATIWVDYPSSGSWNVPNARELHLQEILNRTVLFLKRNWFSPHYLPNRGTAETLTFDNE